MKETLHFALIGCGKITVRHSNLLGNNMIRGGRLAAVVDVQETRAAQIGNKFAVPYYTNYHRMMEREDIDVVVILTESGSHAAHTVALAPYGKSIVVEKPMALTLDDADRMISACDRYGCKLFIIKQNRFNVPIVKMRQALDAGRFGKLVLGAVRVRWCRTQEYYDQAPWRGTWANDGGVLANQASHHIDLLEWFMGGVESVFAHGITALAEIEAEDTAVVTLKFRNGALGIIEATTATRPKDLEGSISILGEKGSVVIGGFSANEMHTWNFCEEEPGDEEIMEKYSTNSPNPYGFAHQAYYEHVIDCTLNNKKQLIDGIEGRKSLELISAIYESIETGKEVFLRFMPKKCRLGVKNNV